MFAELRQRTKTILWIVIVAFVGLMVFVWGMDLRRRSGPESGVIGRVENQRITLQEYRNELANLRARYYEIEKRRPDQQTEREIAEKAWQNIIQRRLLQKEIDRYEMSVTPQEIDFELRTNPPDFVRSQPIFQTDDKFDHEKYLAAIDDPNYDFTPLILYIAQTLPIQKIQRYISSTVRVTSSEVKDLLRVIQDKVSISYVLVDPMVNVREEIPHPTDEELISFFNEHKEELRRPERRKLDYIQIRKVASADDERYAREKIEEAYELVRAGEHFEEIARDFSDDARSAEQGGDMGWIMRGLLESTLDSTIFNLPVGEISQVVRGKQGFYIFLVEQRKEEAPRPSAKVRAIMTAIQPSPITIEELRAQAIEVVRQAKKKGVAEAASAFGYEVKQSDPFSMDEVRMAFAISKENAEAIFNASQNQVVGPIEGSNAFYLVQIGEITPSHIPDFEEVRSFVESSWRYEIRQKKAHAIAEQVRKLTDQGLTLEDAARRSGLAVEKTPFFDRTAVVPGIGGKNQVTAEAFVLEQGKISRVLEANRNYYIIRVDQKQLADLSAFEANPLGYKFSLMINKQQTVLNAWLNNLMKTAKVEDYRASETAYY